METKQSPERLALFTELNKLLGFKVPMDMDLTFCTKKWELDILELDDMLSKTNPDYNNKECMYKEESCSMKDYVRGRYGERASEIISMLLQ